MDLHAFAKIVEAEQAELEQFGVPFSACKLVERDDDGDDADVFARADAGFARADARGGGGGGGARASSFAFDVSASLGCDLELLPARLCGCGSEVDNEGEAACAELAFEPEIEAEPPVRKKAVLL